jgi:hypothetical protein
MDALEPRRCRHCAGILTSLQIDRRDDFATAGPALVCVRCDGAGSDSIGDLLLPD